ncbi:MAG: hypothetical protein OXC48_12485 [Endozoicomonadaceae bacterium]|nr:hypothetical protein [Endozoicomonadaceae bacterium]
MGQPIGGNSGVIVSDSLPRSSQVLSKRPTGLAFNRNVQVQNDATPALPASPTGSAKSTPANTPLAERTVSNLATAQSARHDEPLTAEQFTAIAGDPGGHFQSKTLKGLLSELKKYHKTEFSSSFEKINVLANLQSTAKEFLEKKEADLDKKADKGKELEKIQDRITGTKELLKSINQTLTKTGLEHLRGGTREENQAVVSFLLENNITAELAEAIRHLPEEIRQNCLTAFIGACDGSDRPTEATPAILEIIEQEGGSPEIIEQYTPDLLAAMSQGNIDQCAENVHKVYQAGLLDANMLAAVGPSRITQLQMDADTQQITELKQSVNPSLQKDSPALKNCPDTVITPDDLISDPSNIMKFAVQTKFIFKDRLLKLEGNDPAFKTMAGAWDKFSDHNTIEDHKKTLPDTKAAGKAMDAGGKLFQNELAKINTEYCSRLASGESIDPAAMGWQPLPDGWQTAPDANDRTSQEILADFFYHHAPGIAH